MLTSTPLLVAFFFFLFFWSTDRTAAFDNGSCYDHFSLISETSSPIPIALSVVSLSVQTTLSAVSAMVLGFIPNNSFPNKCSPLPKQGMRPRKNYSDCGWGCIMQIKKYMHDSESCHPSESVTQIFPLLSWRKSPYPTSDEASAKPSSRSKPHVLCCRNLILDIFIHQFKMQFSRQ